MKGISLKKQLTVLLAAVALLLVGAVPVSAAPGGIPGPPAGHEKAKDKPAKGADAAVEVDDEATNETQLPAWAKAYGKRIKDEFGAPYGHIQQCAAASAGDADVVDDDVTVPDDDSNKPFECPENLEFPADDLGAKALWVFTEAGLLVVAF